MMTAPFSRRIAPQPACSKRGSFALYRIADRGYDSDRLREALAERGVKSCIPGRANRKEPIIYDTELYKSRNLIERLFGRLKIGAASPPGTTAVRSGIKALPMNTDAALSHSN